MNATIKYLSLLLLFQLALTGYIQFGRESIGEFHSDEKLITESFEHVTSISLVAPEQKPLELKKQDGAWILPESSNHPAAKQKIETLFSDLEALTRPYPAGNTTLAARNLDTADDKYKHKLSFAGAEGEALTLYFGTSPGFKKVYVRRAGEDKTYAIAFANHNLQTEASFWLDKDVASLDRADVATLSLKDFTLNYTKTPAEISPLPEGKVLDEKKAGQLLSNCTKVRFSDLLGTSEEESFNLKKPALTYSVKTDEGKELTYTYGKPAEGEHFVLKRSDLPYYYNVMKFQVDKITEVTAESLVKDAPAKEAEVPQSETTEDSPPASSDQP